MTNRIKIVNPRVSSFSNNNWVVMCNDQDGREYTLSDEDGTFKLLPFHVAVSLVKKIAAAGRIDPNLWIGRAPYGTAAWHLDGMEERELEDERMGW